jgi:outer membrane lipoprotein-sorting protein
MTASSRLSHGRGVAIVVIAFVVAVGGLMARSHAAAAEEPEAGAAAAAFKDEPAAHALYDQMIDAMRKADSLSYVSHYRWEARGMVLGDSTYRAWLKKPNYFRVEAKSTRGERGGVLIGDGNDLWIYWFQERPRTGFDTSDEAYEKTSRNVYMTKPAGPGMHSIGHETSLLGAGVSVPIIDPSTFHGYTDSLQPYMDGVRSLGTETVGDEECDKIEVSIMEGQRSWYLWLSRSDHLPRRLKQIVRVRYDIVAYEDWSSVTLDADMDDTMFAWTPPEGWTEWRMPGLEERLLKPGTKAPDFELASTGGKPIKLSAYRGQVVWLYIWRAG